MRYTIVVEWPDGKEPPVDFNDRFKGGKVVSVKFSDIDKQEVSSNFMERFKVSTEKSKRHRHPCDSSEHGQPEKSTLRDYLYRSSTV